MGDITSKPQPAIQRSPSALAIATFVLGLLATATGGLTAFPAIVTGIIEFVNIRNGQFSRTGLWLNIVGFTIAVGMLVLMLAAGIAIYNVAQPSYALLIR